MIPKMTDEERIDLAADYAWEERTSAELAAERAAREEAEKTEEDES